MSSAKIFIGLLSLVFIPLITFANDAENLNRKITANAEVFLSKDGPNDFERQQLDNFEKGLVSAGFSLSQIPQFTFFLGLVNVPNAKEHQIAISVFALHALPEKMIEAGAKNELFYETMSNYDSRKLPQDGKFIREYMTSEYLKQFGMIAFTDLVIVSKDQIESEFIKIIDRFKDQNKIYLDATNVVPKQKQNIN
jgi:hypothetical protein